MPQALIETIISTAVQALAYRNRLLLLPEVRKITPKAAAKVAIARSSPRPGSGIETRPAAPAVVAAVVVTVTVMLTGVVPDKFADVGESTQLDLSGAPVQVNVAKPLNPVEPAICRLNVAGWPAMTVADVDPPDGGATAKSEPVPVRVITLCEPAALCVIVSVALLAPAVFGANVTVIVQLASLTNVAGQLLFAVKSEPVSVFWIPLINKSAVPVFLIVTV